jgi:hypothetical protein
LAVAFDTIEVGRKFIGSISELAQLLRLVGHFNRAIERLESFGDRARNRALADLTAGKLGCDRGPELVAICRAQPAGGVGDLQIIRFWNAERWKRDGVAPELPCERIRLAYPRPGGLYLRRTRT